ncbi:MAG TPA: hypothetical protein VKR58_09790, partial [Aquella sp.]|nr:hypothetical protein [Aquella sp.]
YQIFLSKLSCDFILQQSTYSNEKNVNNNLLRKLIKIGDEKRQILPYYYGTKILLSSKNTVAIPIILSLDNGTQYSPQILFFKKNYITNEIMIHSEPNDIDKHTPAVVFQGNGSENLSFNDFKNRILQVGVQNIILLNAASHPQYAGEILRNYVTDPYKDIVLTNKELKEVIVLNNEELSKARVESETIGCCINNPNLFYIKHIFCSTFFDEQNILRRKSLCLKQK